MHTTAIAVLLNWASKEADRLEADAASAGTDGAADVADATAKRIRALVADATTELRNQLLDNQR